MELFAGVRPDTSLAASVGATLGPRGAIMVDRGMRTGLPGVFAAGACVMTHHRLLGQTYLPLGTTAHKQGRVAGENAVGGHREFAGSLGTQVVKIFDQAAARTGLRHHEATAAGFDPVTVESEADGHKAYYPGSHRIRMRFTATEPPGGCSACSCSATSTPRSPSGSTSLPPVRMAEVRNCEQCDAVFVPRREHARFCSARCRAAWNREHARHQTTEATALDWSITAMCDATGRLRRVRAGDQARALAVIGEAVWWVTIVDATLVRHHPAAYDDILAGQPPAERRLVEDTLAGLRFVRNQMGHHLDPADFISPAPGRPSADRNRISAWTWKSLPEPPLASLPPGGRAWERARYQAYQDQLAGHPAGDTFGRAAAFHKLAAAHADLHHEHEHAAAR